jgi:hypothetical protein
MDILVHYLYYIEHVRKGEIRHLGEKIIASLSYKLYDKIGKVGAEASIDIVKLAIHHGATNFNTIAVSSSNIDVVKLAIYIA